MKLRPYIDTIEQKGWNVYDISNDLEQGHVRPWAEIALQGPANELINGGTYIFAPTPEPDQSLRDAYSITKGVGPCIRIADPYAPEYLGMRLQFSASFAVFTRIAMEASGVRLYSAYLPDGTSSDEVLLAPDTAQATFERTFDIITPAEFRRAIAEG